MDLKSRFLTWGWGRESEQMQPRSNSTNLQNGLEWLVYSSLRIMLFLILFCLLQSHVLFSRSQPGNWHFPQPSGSVCLHEGSEEGSQAHAAAEKVGEPSPRLASRRRAGAGNLPPSRSSVTEFKEILPKYKDPDSGRSLGVSRSQYPPARSA